MTPFVVVPAYDEAATVAGVVRRARAHARVIVVDDGSGDGTAEAAARAGAEVCRHARRRGKARALQTGVAAARARGATHVVTLDADGQHDPDDVPALLSAAGARAIVIGVRAHADDALPAGRTDAIAVAGFFVNWASGLRLVDSQSGFRVYPMAVFDEVPTRRGGFVFETEVLLAAAERGWAVREVPVRTLPRAAARSRFRPLVDGVAIGAHLGGRSLVRAAREASAAAAAICALATRSRARPSHTSAWWWRHPRRRRATAAATAVLGLPVVLPLLMLAALTGVRLSGASALVAALYSQARLDTGTLTPMVAV